MTSDPRNAQARQALLDRARDLVPALRARIGAADAARRLPDASIADLRGAGLLGILKPARFGGLGLDLETYGRAVLALGRGCGATAWAGAARGVGQWRAGRYPAAAQDEVWSADGLAAAALAPGGEALADHSGWRLGGRWPRVAAAASADWLLLGCRADGGAALALVPRADVRLDDDAAALGLAGGGGRTVVAEGAAVQGHRLLRLAEPVAADAAALHRVPLAAVLPGALALPVVAIAGGALDDYIATTRERTTRGAAVGGNRSMAEFPTIQLRVAEAASLVDAAELLLCRDLAEADPAPSEEALLRNRRDGAFAARLATQAVDRLFESAGGQGLFSSHPMQRAWRDAHAAAMHASLNWDAVGTLVGRGMLGLPAENAPA
ncbi:MAG: acyl-CoA dehydrogenase family protein [Rhodospirillaceae bacterium]